MPDPVGHTLPDVAAPFSARWAAPGLALARNGVTLACVLAVTACEELPEVRHVTESVELATYSDARVCTGTLDDLERYVREVERRTGLHRNERIRFYWGGDGVAEWCGPRAGGCTLFDGRHAVRVHGMLSAAPHEFAHAVGDVLGRSTHLLEEGFATQAEGQCFLADELPALRPSDLHRLDEEEFDEIGGLGVAASFASYLIERFGREPYHALKAAVPRDASLTRFQDATLDAYGIALEQLEDEWLAHSPLSGCSHGNFWPFDESAPVAYMLAPMTLSAALDCEDPGTKGPMDPNVVLGEVFSTDPVVPGMYADFTLVVPFSIPVMLTFEAPSDAVAYLHVWGWYDCWDGGRVGYDSPDRPLVLSGGESRAVLLDACAWYIALTTPGYDPTTVSLHIEPVPDDG